MDDFQKRFENWRRWCLARGLHQGHAASIEGLYRSPQHWDPPNPKPPMIVQPDAILVNRAYTRLAQIAERQARIIKILTFREYWRPQWQAQKLGIHYLKLDEAYERAKIAFKNQIAFMERRVYKRTVRHNLTTVPAVQLRDSEAQVSPEEA